MKKRSFFSEERLVFQTDPEPPKPVVVPVAPVEAPKEPVVVKPPEAKDRLAKMKTGMDLDQLKDDLKDKLQQQYLPLLNAVNLNGEKVQSILAGVLDFKDQIFVADVSSKIKGLIEKKNLDQAGKILSEVIGEPVSAEDVKLIVSSMYARSALKKAESDFLKDENYPLFNKFREDAKAKGSADYQITTDIVFDGLANFKVTFTPNEKFKEDYGKFKEVEDKKPKDPKEAEEKAKIQASLDVRVDALQKSFAGKALMFLGLIKVPDDVTDPAQKAKILREQYEDIVKGNSLLYNVVCLLGGSHIMMDGGAGYKEMVAGLPAKGQQLVKTLETKTESMPISFKKVVVPGVAEAKDAAAFEQFEADQFGKLIISEEAKVPENGVQLKQAYKVESGKKLVVDLTQGGEMVLPKGKDNQMSVDGKEVSGVDEKKVYSEKTSFKKIEIIGDIPVGVSFNGKVKFEVVG